jgi:hypothetical protein
MFEHEPDSRPLDLSIRAHSFSPSGKRKRVSVAVNGSPLGEVLVGSDTETFRLNIPVDYLRTDLLRVEFRIENPQSPAELGLSNDGRRLGLGLVAIAIQPADVTHDTDGK